MTCHLKHPRPGAIDHRMQRSNRQLSIMPEKGVDTTEFVYTSFYLHMIWPRTVKINVTGVIVL